MIVNAAKRHRSKRPLCRSLGDCALRLRILAGIAVSFLICASPSLAQTGSAAASGTAVSDGAQAGDQQETGSISGRVVDQSGTAVSGAHVALAGENRPKQEVLSDDDGQFYLVNIAPGAFLLSITTDGFGAQTISGTLHPGEVYKVPRVALTVAAVVTQVRVTPSEETVAEAQIKVEEEQRVLGAIPNFYVTYISDAAPLGAKQKFQLAWKSTVDPVTFGLVGATAGLQQAANEFSGYGQGAQGYGKRLGAAYADTAVGTFIGAAVLPSLLKQDPRYFYKGTGSKRSRMLYALAASVICKGDNGRWQPNYSNILGSIAAGGISNLYYPSKNANDAALTFEGAAIGIGATAGANLLQEFVIPKITPKKASKAGSTQSPTQP
jgi:hypothetical protein